MNLEDWIKQVEREGAAPLTREQVDAIWRELFTGEGQIGDFGDTPIEDLLLTIELGISDEGRA